MDHFVVTPIRPGAVRARRSGPDTAQTGVSLKIETISIARDREIYAPEASKASEAGARVEGDGRLLIQRGEVVEELRNTEEGVEQSWIFDRRPGGTGELVVRLRVSGQEHTGATKEGLRFTDPRTGLGVLCGPATWVDARGVRTPVKARYSEGEVELRVAEAVLDSAAYPAVLDPVWSPELGIGPLGPLIPYDAAPQSHAAIAFGQSSYLVVWADYRHPFAVRGARLSQDGSVLDKTGFTIAKGEVDELAVASDGAGYLVVWSDYDAIYGIFVDAAGNPIGERTLIEEGFNYEDDLAVAYDGSTLSYLVVWSAWQATVSGVRVTKEDGAPPTLGQKLSLSDQDASPTGVSVACDGEKCLAVWSDARNGEDTNIYGALVSSDDSNLVIPISTSAAATSTYSAPVVSFDGVEHYLVLWGGSFSGIFGAQVKRTDGAVLNPDKVIALGQKPLPTLARHKNGRLLATWLNFGDPLGYEGAWIDTGSGIDVVDPPMKIISLNYAGPGDHRRSACAGDGTTCALTWDVSVFDEDQNEQFDEVNAVLLSEPSGVSSAIDVIQNWAEQSDPDVTSKKGSGFMVAWAATGQGDQVTLVPAGGGSQQSVGINTPPFSSQDETFLRGPSIAWGNDSYMIAWTKYGLFKETGTIAGYIMGSGGAPISFDIPLDMNSSPSYFKPAVEFDGSNYLIASRVFSSSDAIVVARVDASGEASVTTVYKSDALSDWDVGSPGIDHGGDNSLLVWAGGGVYAARVGMIDGELTTLDSDVIKLSDVSGSDGWAFPSPPDVASDGDGYLAIWRQPELEGGSRIYGSRVSRDGIRIDNGFPISPPNATDVCCAKVTFDGYSYLVAWQEHMDDKLTMFSTWVGREGVVSGITESGQETFEIAQTTAWHPASALASDGAGRSLVTYTRAGVDIEGNHVEVDRVRARYVDNPCALPDVTCPTDLACHNPGECIPNPGADGYTCSPQSPKPDGAECEGGLCFHGGCIPDATTASSSQAASGGQSGFGGSGADGVEGGCGCRIATSTRSDADPSSARMTLLAAALVVVARRRRSRTSNASPSRHDRA